MMNKKINKKYKKVRKYKATPSRNIFNMNNIKLIGFSELAYGTGGIMSHHVSLRDILASCDDFLGVKNNWNRIYAYGVQVKFAPYVEFGGTTVSIHQPLLHHISGHSATRTYNQALNATQRFSITEGQSNGGYYKSLDLEAVPQALDTFTFSANRLGWAGVSTQTTGYANHKVGHLIYTFYCKVYDRQ